MELKAKPRTGGDSNYVKFHDIGDSVRGLFVSYDPDADNGNFGPKPELTLRTKEGIAIITCSAHLKQILDDNEESLENHVITISYIGTKDVGKGNPMKLFKVEAEPAKNAKKPLSKPALADVDDDMPF